MSRIEPSWLRRRRVSIALPRGGPFPPLRVLHLSDFHRSGVVPASLIRKAIRLGLAWGPDLCCVTGDFVTADIPDAADYQAVLRELAERVPTYACLGNHDGGRWAGHHGAALATTEMREFLAGAGIRCLFNESEAVTVRGTPLTLVGLGDLWADDLDPARAFRGLRADGTPCVALCHNPDAKDRLADRPWDLLLCGHTHGGQLRLPLLGTPFAPVQDLRHVVGLHDWSGRPLYITAGVGSLYGLRLNCPPEVGLLSLGGQPPRRA